MQSISHSCRTIQSISSPLALVRFHVKPFRRVRTRVHARDSTGQLDRIRLMDSTGLQAEFQTMTLYFHIPLTHAKESRGKDGHVVDIGDPDPNQYNTATPAEMRMRVESPHPGRRIGFCHRVFHAMTIQQSTRFAATRSLLALIISSCRIEPVQRMQQMHIVAWYITVCDASRTLRVCGKLIQTIWRAWLSPQHHKNPLSSSQYHSLRPRKSTQGHASVHAKTPNILCTCMS